MTMPSVMWPRHGLVALKPKTARNLDSVQGAGWVSGLWRDWDPDAVFVDDTGGYGAGWIDQLRQLNRAPIGVAVCRAQPNDTAICMNKRAEMYFLAADWVRNGGQLPSMDTPGMAEFTAAMTRTTYSYRGDKLLLEPKGPGEGPHRLLARSCRRVLQ